MKDKELQACLDYINKHAAALHGVVSGKLDIGPEITRENVISANVVGREAVLVIDRGIKGTPKYILSLDEVEKGVAPTRSAEAAEAEAKKVDALQAKMRGK